MKQPVKLTTNEAIVLQQVNEDGEDDIRTLASQLGMSRTSLYSTIERLKHKGLVAMNNSLDDLWIRLTRKGQQLVHYVWPESNNMSLAM